MINFKWFSCSLIVADIDEDNLIDEMMFDYWIDSPISSSETMTAHWSSTMQYCSLDTYEFECTDPAGASITVKSSSNDVPTFFEVTVGAGNGSLCENFDFAELAQGEVSASSSNFPESSEGEYSITMSSWMQISDSITSNVNERLWTRKVQANCTDPDGLVLSTNLNYNADENDSTTIYHTLVTRLESVYGSEDPFILLHPITCSSSLSIIDVSIVSSTNFLELH